MMPRHFEGNFGRYPVFEPGNPFDHTISLPPELGRDLFAALSTMPSELATTGFTAEDVLGAVDSSNPAGTDALAATQAGLEILAASSKGLLSKTETGFRIPETLPIDIAELSNTVILHRQLEQLRNPEESS